MVTRRLTAPLLALSTLIALAGCSAPATPAGGHAGGGEANIHLPDLGAATFLGGMVNGRLLLFIGLVVCLGGLAFGLASYVQLKQLPVHRAMREISELIYETCKAYLKQQGRFLADGRYELKVPYSVPRELLMDVLHYGADAEIVEPTMLREQAKSLLSLALSQYDR